MKLPQELLDAVAGDFRSVSTHSSSWHRALAEERCRGRTVREESRTFRIQALKCPSNGRTQSQFIFLGRRRRTAIVVVPERQRKVKIVGQLDD